MDIKSKEIILRHLKGIINELQKDLKRDKELVQLKVYEKQLDRRKVKMNSFKPVLG